MKKLLFSFILTLSSLSVFAQYDTEIDMGLRLKYSSVGFSDIDRSAIKDQGGVFSANGISLVALFSFG